MPVKIPPAQDLRSGIGQRGCDEHECKERHQPLASLTEDDIQSLGAQQYFYRLGWEIDRRLRENYTARGQHSRFIKSNRRPSAMQVFEQDTDGYLYLIFRLVQGCRKFLHTKGGMWHILTPANTPPKRPNLNRALETYVRHRRDNHQPDEAEELQLAGRIKTTLTKNHNSVTLRFGRYACRMFCKQWKSNFVQSKPIPVNGDNNALLIDIALEH